MGSTLQATHKAYNGHPSSSSHLVTENDRPSIQPTKKVSSHKKNINAK